MLSRYGVSTTIIRHPAPSICRSDHRVFSAQNKTTEPQNNISAGIAIPSNMAGTWPSIFSFSGFYYMVCFAASCAACQNRIKSWCGVVIGPVSRTRND